MPSSFAFFSLEPAFSPPPQDIQVAADEEMFLAPAALRPGIARGSASAGAGEGMVFADEVVAAGGFRQNRPRFASG